MSNDLKRVIDNTELDSTSILSVKHFHRSSSCLLDLPDEILLLIYRYLSPADVLYSFYTPKMANIRFHRLISDYYTKIKLDATTYAEYQYLVNLLMNSTNPLQHESLILSNEHVSCVIYRYFSYTKTHIIHSIFSNLRRLTLIDCFPSDLETMMCYYSMNLNQLEYLHVTVRDVDQDMTFVKVQDGSIERFVFANHMCALQTFINDSPGGLILNKSLISHKILHHINVVLQTIDDLYILLDGLVPNVEKMIVQLRQSRLLTCRRPPCVSICSRLIEFTLLEPCIGLLIDDIEFIFGYMPKLIKLTLSIRDTSDSTFCHGEALEAILTKYLSHLRQFHYTMTHRINERTLIKDFIQWPMNVVFYENENCKWVHIYSSPWPSDRDDKRQLPITNSGSDITVLSNVQRNEYMKLVKIIKHDDLIELKTRFHRAYQLTTCLLIDIALPERISKVILTSQTPISLENCKVQPFVYHLIVQRRLYNENEISTLAYQFPNVKYLQLLFPLNQSAFLRCFQAVFKEDDDSVSKKRLFWLNLVNFCTVFRYEQTNTILNDNKLYRWIIENTDIKYHKLPFYANCSGSMFSIWL